MDSISILLLDNLEPALFQQSDSNHIRISEQIVQIAKRFLIGTNKEHPDIIIILLIQIMHRQNR